MLVTSLNFSESVKWRLHRGGYRGQTWNHERNELRRGAVVGHRHEIALLPGPHFHPQSAISYETVTPDTATAPITVSIRIPAENQCQKHDTRTDRNPGPFSLVAMRWTRTAVRKRSEVLRPCTGGGPLQFSTITTRTVDHCNKQSTTAVAVAE